MLWPSVLAHRSADVHPDQIGSVASGTELTVDLLAPRAQPSYLTQTRSPDRWALDAALLHGKIRAGGSLSGGSAAILFVSHGAGVSMSGRVLHDGAIVVLPAGTELDVRIKSAFGFTGVVLDPARWAAIAAGATGMAGPSDTMRVFTIGKAEAARIGRAGAQATLAMAAAVGEDADTASADDIFAGYAALLAEACAAAEDRYEAIDRSAHNLMRQAEMAEDYIRANIAAPISVQRLCEVVGVSRRQLEYAFRASFDISPAEFIRSLRLNEIRRTLLTAPPRQASVTGVALDLGITHLSRFAGSYHNLFGELPSRTRAADR
jgi:AraC family ethanolamine operon transcriptional activator